MHLPGQFFVVHLLGCLSLADLFFYTAGVPPLGLWGLGGIRRVAVQLLHLARIGSLPFANRFHCVDCAALSSCVGHILLTLTDLLFLARRATRKGTTTM